MAKADLTSHPYVLYIDHSKDAVMVDRTYLESIMSITPVVSFEDDLKRLLTRAIKEDRQILNKHLQKIDLMEDPNSLKVLRRTWSMKIDITKHIQADNSFLDATSVQQDVLPEVEKKPKSVVTKPKEKKIKHMFPVTIEADRTINTLR